MTKGGSEARGFQHSQRGVALIMALGSIVVLTALAVEFGFNSHVAYSMAKNEQDRLQAYYMARSALQFAKMEIQLEKEVRQKFSGIMQQAGVSNQPLCQQVPFDTLLLRGLLPSTDAEETKKETAETPEETQENAPLGLAQKDQAEAFLD
ncbi:MAG: hypothetical protein Q7S00_03150, partial [bacterium]|nr:hypothetical protein [bacterium]